MAREQAHLFDIMDSAKSAIKFAGEIDLATLAESRLYRHAIIKELEIMGEAAKRIPRAWRDSHSEIPWLDIIDYRNSLVHEYDTVDVEEVWRVVTEDLPKMVMVLEQLIREFEKEFDKEQK